MQLIEQKIKNCSPSFRWLLEEQDHHISSTLQFSWHLRFKTLNLWSKRRAITQKGDFKALLDLCNNVFWFNTVKFPPSGSAFSAVCFIFSFLSLLHSLSLWYGWESTIVYCYKLLSVYVCKTSLIFSFPWLW